MKILLMLVTYLFCMNAYSQTMEEILKKISENEAEAELLVERQLEGYNRRDIELFLEPYSDSVKVYTFPDVLKYTGKEKMREIYASMFKQLSGLHCDIVKRIVYGSTVIDHEKVTGLPDNFELNAAVIYTIEAGKISKVYFLKQI